MESFASKDAATGLRRWSERKYLLAARFNRLDRFLHHRRLADAGGATHQYDGVAGAENVLHGIALACAQPIPFEAVAALAECPLRSTATAGIADHPHLFGEHFPRRHHPLAVAIIKHEVQAFH